LGQHDFSFDKDLIGVLNVSAQQNFGHYYKKLSLHLNINKLTSELTRMHNLGDRISI
jgi:hypothetical protein